MPSYRRARFRLIDKREIATRRCEIVEMVEFGHLLRFEQSTIGGTQGKVVFAQLGSLLWR
jgi:hypothetical protein